MFMATPAALYFAGIGTVVGAISLGFAGAMVLMSTQPVHKEPPAAFAKRNQPVEVVAPAQARSPAPTAETTGQAPARTASFEIVPSTPTKVEEVVGLQFAPPQPKTIDAPAPQTIGPDVKANPATATPEIAKPIEPAVKPATDKPASDAVKTEPKMKKEYRKPTALTEKKETVRKQYVERRKKEIADDDEPIRTTSFASEREPRGGQGFFSFLFGN
jgi:hypothetical protein